MFGLAFRSVKVIGEERQMREEMMRTSYSIWAQDFSELQFWAKTVDLSVRLRECQRGAVQNATKYHVAIPRTTRGLGNRSEPKAQKSSTSVLFERRKPPVSFSLQPYFLVWPTGAVKPVVMCTELEAGGTSRC